MKKTNALLVCVAAFAALACGSSKKANGGAGGNVGAGASGNLNLGGTLSGDGGNLVGGVVQITAAQADALRHGSCAGWEATTESQPAIMDMVVDVSGSMDKTAPGGTASKWTVTRDALSAAIKALPDSTGVGMLFFPNMSNVTQSTTARDVSACVDVSAMIPVALLATAQRTKLSDALQAAIAAGGTPTHDAYRYALTKGLLPTTLPGNKFMLLITDGQPTYSLNCIGDGLTQHPVDPQPIIDEIGNAFKSSAVRTFVIGSPGSEQGVSTGDDERPWLSQAARAGGTGAPGCVDTGPNYCHMDMTQAPDFAAALRDGLQKISGQLVSCDYPMPQPPAGQTVDAAHINVLYTDGAGQAQLILQSAAATCTQGWQLVDNKTIHLCSDSCTKVKADSAASLEVLGGCATITGLH